MTMGTASLFYYKPMIPILIEERQNKLKFYYKGQLDGNIIY